MVDEPAKASILLVDDRPEKVLAIEAVLEEMGQNIVRAYSGREALRHVLAGDFAVILLDVNMPGMDGFETAEIIRKRKNSEHIPIIFVTAFGDDFHMARGYSLGAVDYITAPVIPEVLRSKVAVFVELYQKTEQVRRQAESLRQRAAQLQQLAAASLAINAARSVEKMLQSVADTAAHLIGAHQAVTLFADPRSSRRHDQATAFGSFSDNHASWRMQPLKLAKLTETAAYESAGVTRLTAAELEAHADGEILRGLPMPAAAGGVLACPLISRNGLRLGIIYLSEPMAGAFTDDDEVLLAHLAQVTSVAVENALFVEEREANRLKDEFLCTLSHELRTPLNAILGWTQILKLETPDGDTGHALDVIDRNARAQKKLIEDMLDVSRITTGKLRINRTDVDLLTIISTAADSVAPAAEAKGISVEAKLPPEPIWLHADADRLQQVAWNLLTNAVKFTPPKGKITISTLLQDGEVQLRVTDTGCGISPAFLPQVFEAFRQADSTSTRSHGGLGIGLTIVRHIIESHGGRVWAESLGDGTGSTFVVVLPLSQAKMETPATPVATNGERRKPVDAELSGLRILVVDDEADSRDVVQQMLLMAGAEVEVCSSATEGLRVLCQIKPDVLLSDIAMPDIDGFAFIKSVRQLSGVLGGHTPAIALTAYAREEDKERSLSSGFQAHLVKPIEPSELIRVVRSCGMSSTRPASPVPDVH